MGDNRAGANAAPRHECCSPWPQRRSGEAPPPSSTLLRAHETTEAGRGRGGRGRPNVGCRWRRDRLPAPHPPGPAPCRGRCRCRPPRAPGACGQRLQWEGGACLLGALACSYAPLPAALLLRVRVRRLLLPQRRRPSPPPLRPRHLRLADGDPRGGQHLFSSTPAPWVAGSNRGGPAATGPSPPGRKRAGGNRPSRRRQRQRPARPAPAQHAVAHPMRPPLADARHLHAALPGGQRACCPRLLPACAGGENNAEDCCATTVSGQPGVPVPGVRILAIACRIAAIDCRTAGTGCCREAY